MAVVLMLLPSRDFDPTESGVPWLELVRRGHKVRFATPTGSVPVADARMLDGNGLGPWKPLLRANRFGRQAYSDMASHPDFGSPWSYGQASAEPFDALLLPGGHAPGMREYLEAPDVRNIVANAFGRDRPVAAICHGVLAVARTKTSAGRSVLYGRKTTALTARLELAASALTPWLGTYYRTYPTTVQHEVSAALASPADFQVGPLPLLRDGPGALTRGFVVRDGNYLSARWPGDAHRFAVEFADLLHVWHGAA